MPEPGSEGAADVERARMLAAEGELTAALRILEALLEREPEGQQALLLLGGVLLQLREEQRALECLEHATSLAPESAEAQNGLARCLHAMGRNQEALARALVARELLQRPENFAQTAPVYLTLVWVHRDERRFREALHAAEQGLELCADSVLAQWASVVEEELEEAEQERC